MGKRLYLKILIGSLLAFTGLLTIAASLTISSIAQLHQYLVHSVSGLAATGCILVLIGLVKSSRQRRAAQAQASDQSARHAHSHDHDDVADPLGFFRQLQFWGSILLIASLPTFFLCRGMIRPKAPVVAAPSKPKPKPLPAKPPEAPAPVVQVTFPTLKVTGIVYSGAKSTAVLNGHTVQLGEWVEGVRVIAIEPTGVTVELGGQTRQFELN